MIRLLITGASGFLGVPCVRWAMTACASVHAVVRTACHSFPPGVRYHSLDLFDPHAVEYLLHVVRPTHLLHLAWVATPCVYWESPENSRWLTASKHLISAFRASGGQRVVVAGTCAEYDWTQACVCSESSTPIKPATTYGRRKNELREWLETVDVEWAWARLFFLYGPREHPLRLVPSVTLALFANSVAECSAGTHERDFLHVDDVADALVSLTASDLRGPINIGSGAPVAVKTLINYVAEFCGRSDLIRLGTRPLAASEPTQLVADNSRLRDELGWQPKIKLGDGVADTVNWWRNRRAA